MSIKDAIFAVESVAHLQGKEKELLPIVEAARKEHFALRSLIIKFVGIYTEDKIVIGEDDQPELVELLKEAERLVS